MERTHRGTDCRDLRSGTTLSATAKKLLLHHGVVNPAVYVPGFFTFFGLWMGLSAAVPAALPATLLLTPFVASQEILRKARNDYWSTLTKCWYTWIPATTVQFLFVPVKLQVTYIAGVAFGWNILLSILYNEDSTQQQQLGRLQSARLRPTKKL